ncbi:hypothetical protein STEG23_030073, partial [Scotinomys teguina]
ASQHIGKVTMGHEIYLLDHCLLLSAFIMKDVVTQKVGAPATRMNDSVSSFITRREDQREDVPTTKILTIRQSLVTLGYLEADGEKHDKRGIRP